MIEFAQCKCRWMSEIDRYQNDMTNLSIIEIGVRATKNENKYLSTGYVVLLGGLVANIEGRYHHTKTGISSCCHIYVRVVKHFYSDCLSHVCFKQPIGIIHFTSYPNIELGTRRTGSGLVVHCA